MRDLWNILFRDGGIHLPDEDLWLDPKARKNSAVVSHAHADHIAPHATIIASPETHVFLKKRLHADFESIAPAYREPVKLGEDLTVTLYPSGHIVGSSMVLVESKSKKLLYTGDFKLVSTYLARPCEPVHADVLIMETTFGRPEYVFPSPADVMEEIAEFCNASLDEGDVPVLFAYSLGKSQKLTFELGRRGFPIMLHPSVALMSDAFASLAGYPPIQYKPLSPGKVHGHVLIFPPSANQSAMLRKIPNHRSAMISGWGIGPNASYRYQTDTVFPLSDHADYNELKEFVKIVNPSQIFTLHGYAKEFAEDLRRDGRDAWAITSDNQLDLGIDDPSSPSNRAFRTSKTAIPPDPKNPPSSFAAFCEMMEAASRTNRKKLKSGLLADSLRAIAECDDSGQSLRLAALFACGRAFSSHDRTKTGVGISLVKRVLLAVTGCTPLEYRQSYLRNQDTAMTILELMAEEPSLGLSLEDIFDAFIGLAQASNPKEKIALLEKLFRQVSAIEAKWLTRILIGDMRSGIKESMVEEAISAAFSHGIESIRAAHLLCGDIGETALRAFHGSLEQVGIRHFRPVRFMLASPEPTAIAAFKKTGPGWIAENKYDGIRCQVHKHGPRVELYSRDLHPITSSFPEIVREIAGTFEDFILDGELCAIGVSGKIDFNALQKRIGRKEPDLFLGKDLPVKFFAFDCLSHNREEIFALPLKDRRARLESISLPACAEVSPARVFSGDLDIEKIYSEARAAGHEGIMLKDPASTYQPGKRGSAWIKLKKSFLTLDVVVTAARWGHGKRKGLLSDYTFAVRGGEGRLADIGKAYSGLANEEIHVLTRRFLDSTTEIVHGKNHKVRPEVVLEIAFDKIRPSDRHPAGFALRFPRILRIRHDKSPDEIDTLETCRAMAEGTSIRQPSA